MTDGSTGSTLRKGGISQEVERDLSALSSRRLEAQRTEKRTLRLLARWAALKASLNLLLHMWLGATLGLRRRNGDKWIVRPVVLGIAAAEFFAYLLIRIGPEAGEILGDLHGSFRGR